MTHKILKLNDGKINFIKEKLAQSGVVRIDKKNCRNVEINFQFTIFYHIGWISSKSKNLQKSHPPNKPPLFTSLYKEIFFFRILFT